MYFNLPDLIKEDDVESEEACENLYPNEKDFATIYQNWKKYRRSKWKSYSNVHKTDPSLRKFWCDKKHERLKNAYEFLRRRPEHTSFLHAYLVVLEEQPEDEMLAREDIEALFYIILEDEKVPSF